MKPATIIITKYSVILFIWVLLLWWALFLSPFDVPEYIPYTPIKIYGLAFTAFILTILILSHKEALRKIPGLSISGLIFIGTAICFIMELLFQFTQSFTLTSDKLRYFVSGVKITTIYGAILSFLIAFQLKTKRTNLLLLFIVIIFLLFKVLTMVFPSMAAK
jgi:hypothetical protein